MGVRSKIKFLSSGEDVNPRNLGACTPLVSIQLGGDPTGAQFVPRLGSVPRHHRLVSAGEWWERTKIYRSGPANNTLTRKSLVFALRNKEGGGHFDDIVFDRDYIEVTHGKTWIKAGPDGVERELRELEHASMRQIAWELLETLHKEGLAS
jgi:hypothetical protein